MSPNALQFLIGRGPEQAFFSTLDRDGAARPGAARLARWPLRVRMSESDRRLMSSPVIPSPAATLVLLRDRAPSSVEVQRAHRVELKNR